MPSLFLTAIEARTIATPAAIATFQRRSRSKFFSQSIIAPRCWPSEHRRDSGDPALVTRCHQAATRPHLRKLKLRPATSRPSLPRSIRRSTGGFTKAARDRERGMVRRTILGVRTLGPQTLANQRPGHHSARRGCHRSFISSGISGQQKACCTTLVSRPAASARYTTMPADWTWP
jgi:hypothetical protein